MIAKFKNKIYWFLRNTQKYTGTDNVYLARGGVWLFLGETISIGISILSGLAFANLIDPAIYGKYRYILSLAYLLSRIYINRTAIIGEISLQKFSLFIRFSIRVKSICIP